ncbi:shikimate kinase [Syntrophomonas palmitatica]|uniref:shikimate kinase n=1 Tax=Syntrophomonas palmitatica TaxID=402877 RepID=UPI0006D0DA08|nr:shikimate kinase [Syntrophomonas palmitatica]
MGKNIVLIGFMGTGKSSVGWRLAQKLKMNFLDMDREIERITGMPVNELFRRYGETRFRSEEKLLANKLAQRNDLVIATGGGVVLQTDNMDALRNNGIIVGLEASPQEILDRVQRKKGSRPLIKKDVTLEDIKEFLDARKEFYDCADFKVYTGKKEIETVVDEIIELLKDRLD